MHTIYGDKKRVAREFSLTAHFSFDCFNLNNEHFADILWNQLPN